MKSDVRTFRFVFRITWVSFQILALSLGAFPRNAEAVSFGSPSGLVQCLRRTLPENQLHRDIVCAAPFCIVALIGCCLIGKGIYESSPQVTQLGYSLAAAGVVFATLAIGGVSRLIRIEGGETRISVPLEAPELYIEDPYIVPIGQLYGYPVYAHKNLPQGMRAPLREALAQQRYLVNENPQARPEGTIGDPIPGHPELTPDFIRSKWDLEPGTQGYRAIQAILNVRETLRSGCVVCFERVEDIPEGLDQELTYRIQVTPEEISERSEFQDPNLDLNSQSQIQLEERGEPLTQVGIRSFGLPLCCHSGVICDQCMTSLPRRGCPLCRDTDFSTLLLWVKSDVTSQPIE